MPTVTAAKDEEFIDPPALAKRWGIEVGTLENWRCCKPRKGPRYVKIGGRIKYRLQDVVAYETKNTVSPEPQTAGAAS